jgi:hypothetical protein
MAVPLKAGHELLHPKQLRYRPDSYWDAPHPEIISLIFTTGVNPI